MFAIPLFGLRRLGQQSAPLPLRLVALSGFVMTLLYVALSVFPIIEVKSTASFTSKITAVIIIANVCGLAIYFIAGRRRGAILSNTR